MIKPLRLAMPLIVLLLIPQVFAVVNAGSPISTSPSPEYVSIYVEFHGLEESSALLNQAIGALAITLEEVAKKPENLSVEQLREINLLVEQADSLTQSLTEALDSVTPTIGRASEQTTRLVASAVEAARVNGVDPALESINRSVQSWLVLLIVGAVVILAVLGFALYRSIKQFQELVAVAKSITEEYEIVRRSRTDEPEV